MALSIFFQIFSFRHTYVYFVKTIPVPPKKGSKITKNKLCTGLSCPTGADLYYMQIYVQLFQFQLLKSKLCCKNINTRLHFKQQQFQE